MKDRKQQVGQTRVLEEQPTQRFAPDGDVAHRLRGHRGQVDGLAIEQVHLAEEPVSAMTNDLAARGVLDGRLALPDGDQRILAVPDREQDFAHLRSAFLAMLGQGCDLRFRQNRADALCHH